MNVIYLGSFRLPNFDAAAARVLNIARALRLAGHKVNFISWGGENCDCDLCPDGQYRIDDFEYIVTNELDPKGSIIKKLRCKLTRGNRTKNILSKRLGSYDAIITYNCSLSRWLISFTKKHHIKLVNDITEWYEYNELKASDWLTYAWNMHCTQKNVPNKIVISSYLDRIYNMTHNIVVPATCDVSEPKWSRGMDNVFGEIGYFDGVTLIYAGNPARKDAVHYVINAVNTLANEGAKVRFLIIGVTKEQYLERYMNLLKGKKLNDSIKFLGRVSQDDVPSYYALADFMVLLREPTRKSNAGFPTKFSESFTSGTPVIANLTSDLGLYLKDGETGFVVDNPSEEAIYRTLKEKVLHLNKEDIESLKRNVRETAKQLDYHAFVEPLRFFMNDLR